MPADDVEISYARLREASIVDPLHAKAAVRSLLDGDMSALTAVLTAAEEPSGGRVRSLIARAAQGHRAFHRVAPTLERWLRTERDEFARLAIGDALASIAPKQKRALPAKLTSDLPDLARTYDFLTGRLRHRVLNALPRAALSIDRVRDALSEGLGQATILQLVDELETTLRTVQKAMDLVADEGDFQPRDIDLVSWLQDYSSRFRSSRPGVEITIISEERAGVAVHANGYLLETIFRNLWTNCVQAVGGSCRIVTQVSVSDTLNIVTILDNGPGFTTPDIERAFKLQYSSSGDPARGRGHMEVADAIRRLGGEAMLATLADEGIRVVLRLPRQ
jgi:signal transduction histidine kinase